MRLAFASLIGLFATCSAALAGTWSVVSTSSQITWSSGDSWFFTDATNTIDNRTAEMTMDLNRTIGFGESWDGLAYGSVETHYGWTSTVRYTADVNETVNTNTIWPIYWETRCKSHTSVTTVDSGDYSYTFDWKTLTECDVAGALGFNEQGTWSGSSPWVNDGTLNSTFQLHHVSGNIYEATISTGTKAMIFDYLLEWTPFDGMSSHPIYATGDYVAQCKVVIAGAQSYAGF